ncbi:MULTISPECIES: hypothetical protein [unclassified Carboxylicivirga]|uniref:hypothetical protein n=1 Tax=Carboxylicivirga TaxID=1628153 RepID=UPI003D32BFF5
MRRYFVIVLFAFGLLGLSAQENRINDVNSKLGLSKEELPGDSLKMAEFGIMVGLSAFSDFDGMYGFNTYVAPHWSLMPFKKIQIDVLPYLGRTSFYNLPAWGQVDATQLTLDASMLQIGVYAQANYLLTEKWYVGASVFLDRHIPESSASPLQGFNNYGASGHVGYRFTESFSAQLSLGVSKYQGLAMPSPGFIPMMHPRNPYNRFQ